MRKITRSIIGYMYKIYTVNGQGQKRKTHTLNVSHELRLGFKRGIYIKFVIFIRNKACKF